MGFSQPIRFGSIVVASLLLVMNADARPRTASRARPSAGRTAMTIRPLDARNSRVARSRQASARTAAARQARTRAYLSRLPGMGRRDAYSPAAMPTKQKLLQCLEHDHRFRKNLATHFGVPESQLVDYVEENVELFALQQDLKTDVYAVTKTGRRYKVAQRIPRGTLVFGLPEGVVMMKSNCGNPVIAYLPPVGRPLPTTAEAAGLPGPVTADQAPEIVMADRALLPEAVAGFLEEQPVVAVAPPPPMPVEPAPVIAPPVAAEEAAPVAERRRRRGGFPWFLAGLGLIPLIDDDDDDGGRRRRLPPGPAPQPVPEPGTLVLFGAGALAMLAARRRCARRLSA